MQNTWSMKVSSRFSHGKRLHQSLYSLYSNGPKSEKSGVRVSSQLHGEGEWTGKKNFFPIAYVWARFTGFSIPTFGLCRSLYSSKFSPWKYKSTKIELGPRYESEKNVISWTPLHLLMRVVYSVGRCYRTISRYAAPSYGGWPTFYAWGCPLGDWDQDSPSDPPLFSIA